MVDFCVIWCFNKYIWIIECLGRKDTTWLRNIIWLSDIKWFHIVIIFNKFTHVNVIATSSSCLNNCPPFRRFIIRWTCITDLLTCCASTKSSFPYSREVCLISTKPFERCILIPLLVSYQWHLNMNTLHLLPKYFSRTTSSSIP